MIRQTHIILSILLKCAVAVSIGTITIENIAALKTGRPDLKGRQALTALLVRRVLAERQVLAARVQEVQEEILGLRGLREPMGRRASRVPQEKWV